jgi:hypothetical protein
LEVAMGRPGIQKITRYSDDFKVTAVRLIDLPEVLIQDVVAALANRMAFFRSSCSSLRIAYSG